MQDLMAEFYDGPHATPAPATDGPVYLGIKNVTEDGHLDFTDIRHIAEDDYAHWIRRVEPRPGDLVFTYEASLHRYAIIPEGFRGCLGRRLALIRTRPEMVDTRFLLYLFLSPQWRAAVSQRINVGSTVDRIPLTEFPKFPVAVPDLTTQRHIAGLLGSYDDLIEINTRRIQILEEMAQSIYREWFVEFRYPGHEESPLVESDLGHIPAGWRVRPLGEVVRHERRSINPTELGAELVSHFSLPAFDATHQPVVEAGAEIKSLKYEVTEKCVLYSKLNPRIPRVWVATPDPARRSVASTEFLVLTPCEMWSLPMVAAVCSSPDFANRVVGMAGGTSTSHQRVKPGDLLKLLIVDPDAKTCSAFETAAAPLFDLMDQLRLATLNLRVTRDLLLPRLISGVVDVAGLEIDVTEPAA